MLWLVLVVGAVGQVGGQEDWTSWVHSLTQAGHRGAPGPQESPDTGRPQEGSLTPGRPQERTSSIHTFAQDEELPRKSVVHPTEPRSRSFHPPTETEPLLRAFQPSQGDYHLHGGLIEGPEERHLHQETLSHYGKPKVKYLLADKANHVYLKLPISGLLSLLRGKKDRLGEELVRRYRSYERRVADRSRHLIVPIPKIKSYKPYYSDQHYHS